jgi:hypothetical protein
MRRFEWGGVELPVPTGWEARGGGSADAPTSAARRSLERPYVHLANFALSSPRGPYGSGVVGGMGSDDVFVALVQFLPESAHTRLFADVGIPRRLRDGDFSSSSLQRTLKGQLGVQRFFSDSSRALCLYVVMGGVPALRQTLPTLNEILAGAIVRQAAVIP